jgi:hypothetical protein
MLNTKFAACLFASLLLNATPISAETAEELLSNPDVIATCAAKGAVPDSVTRISKTEVSVNCKKAEQRISSKKSAVFVAEEYGRDDVIVEEAADTSVEGTYVLPAVVLPALILGLLGGDGSTSGTN